MFLLPSNLTFLSPLSPKKSNFFFQNDPPILLINAHKIPTLF